MVAYSIRQALVGNSDDRLIESAIQARYACRTEVHSSISPQARHVQRTKKFNPPPSELPTFCYNKKDAIGKYAVAGRCFQ